MKLYQLEEYVNLYREINSSGLSDAAKMKLRDCLQEQFDIESSKHQETNPTPSEAEIAIAKGTYHHLGNCTLAGHTAFGMADKALAVKLFRSRSGLRLREAKEAIESAVANKSNEHIILDTTEKQAISMHYRSDDFDNFDALAHQIAYNRQMTVGAIKKAIDAYVQTL